MVSPSEPASGGAPPESRGRLDGWKQIAAYLDMSERTVRRWQQTEALPVHRHLHQQRGTVWAYREELDEWQRQRQSSPTPHEAVAPESFRRWFVWGGIGLAAAALALGFLLLRGRPQATLLPEGVPLTAYPGPAYGPSFLAHGRQARVFC